MKHELAQTETDPLEEEFLNILSDLIDDPIWLEMVLNQNNAHQAGAQLANQSINGRSLTNFEHLADLQGSANKLAQPANNAQTTQTDLEDTMIISTNVSTDVSAAVSTDAPNWVSSDLSLQAYPYPKSTQKD